ncbi:MAG: MFS transporter, partial [Sphingomicrobium sp.]
AALMSLGHVAMSFDESFLIALVLLIAGSGCLKGNISAQVATLYPADEGSRRDRGFTIFSTGINIGAVIGPLATGALAQAYGWHAGFACAAVLMLVALLTYTLGRNQLPDAKPRRNPPGVVEPPLSKGERRRVGVLLLLVAINVPIAMCYNQITNVGLIWIDEHVALKGPLFTVPTSWFNALDSFASIVAAVPLIALWAAQFQSGKEPDSLKKIVIGALINGLASMLLVAGIMLTPSGTKTNALWPIACWIVMGVAFMYYWPTTLALVAGKSPERLRSTLMGSSFLALFVGNVLLGWVGSFYQQMSPAQFWTMNSAIGLAGAIIGAVCLSPMRKLLAQDKIFDSSGRRLSFGQ